MTTLAGVPIIDVGALRSDDPRSEAVARVAQAVDAACRDTGFFCVTGHGVDPALLGSLDGAARRFFALPAADKGALAMARAGRAWRGWFPLGGELTSGRPDQKEGLYFGEELPPDDPRVRAGRPLHGPNLFPTDVPDLGPAVLDWMSAMTALGHLLLRGIALGLGLEQDWFERDLTREPTVLFRIFRYPPTEDEGWGVGEHTDYGLLTILAQDERGGLQVRGRSGWIEVPPAPGVLVCNLGDMLDRMTAGRYRSTPHRVRNATGGDRLSFPFFFDPNFFARVQPIELAGRDLPPDDRDERWDKASVHAFEGTYGDYLLGKVGKVFPQLRAAVL
jgi:isopenicillin N synthase-like dioxygenase